MQENKFFADSKWCIAAIIADLGCNIPKVINGLFTKEHIYYCTVPSEFHLYELRHIDGDHTCACEIGTRINENFMGTFITDQRISRTMLERPLAFELDDGSYRTEFYYDDSDALTLTFGDKDFVDNLGNETTYKDLIDTDPYGTSWRRRLAAKTSHFIHSRIGILYELAGHPEMAKDPLGFTGRYINISKLKCDKNTYRNYKDMLNILNNKIAFNESNADYPIDIEMSDDEFLYCINLLKELRKFNQQITTKEEF